MGKSTPQIQTRWRVCPHRSTAGCCPMGMSIRNSSSKTGAGGTGSMHQVIRCWKGWRRKHERGGKACGPIRSRSRSGNGGRNRVSGRAYFLALARLVSACVDLSGTELLGKIKPAGPRSTGLQVCEGGRLLHPRYTTVTRARKSMSSAVCRLIASRSSRAAACSKASPNILIVSNPYPPPSPFMR